MRCAWGLNLSFHHRVGARMRQSACDVIPKPVRSARFLRAPFAPGFGANGQSARVEPALSRGEGAEGPCVPWIHPECAQIVTASGYYFMALGSLIGWHLQSPRVKKINGSWFSMM